MIVTIDTREKTPVIFPTGVVVVRQTLSAGDYRCDCGSKALFAERKTVVDLYRTFAKPERANKQLESMTVGSRGAALLIQATPCDVLTYTGESLIGRNQMAFLSHVYKTCRRLKVEVLWTGDDPCDTGLVLTSWFKSFFGR